ncbi:MAG: hypothetical protein ABH952_03800 [Candidatus Omnitrophota bacterium]
MKIKFWKGPSHSHRVAMVGFISAGLLGVILGIYFKDKNTILSSFGIIIIGVIFGGIQSIAWKQWEEQHKKKK